MEKGPVRERASNGGYWVLFCGGKRRDINVLGCGIQGWDSRGKTEKWYYTPLLGFSNVLVVFWDLFKVIFTVTCEIHP